MERVDELKNSLKIIQDPKLFCFGVDAVLLSDFASKAVLPKKNLKICDLGCGNGIIPLLLSTGLADNNKKIEKIFGLEIQPNVAQMAKKSVKLNSLEDKIEIIEGDLKNSFEIFEKNTFDVVTSNPPYINAADGRNCLTENMRIARHEVMCNLDDVVSAASGLLNSHGKFFMIHKPFRLSEIILTLTKYKLEPKRIQFVHPTKEKEATMVLVEAEKSGHPRVKIEGIHEINV